jgi:Tfp pilus assembly protein PilO
MKQSSKRFISLMVAVVLLFAALIIYFNFIQPAYGDAEQAKNDMLAKQDFVNNQKSAIQQVKNLVAQYQGKGDVAQAVSLALPTNKNQADAFHVLSGLADLHHLSLQSFAASAAAAQNITVGQASSTSLVRPTGSLLFQIKFAGAYADFKAFLQNIETNVRIFDVRSLGVAPLGKPGQDFFTFDLTVATYYQNI